MNAQNPWASRYEQINSIDIIRTLTFQPAAPLSGLDDDSIEGASIRIGDAWRRIFVPTGQACEIMLMSAALLPNYTNLIHQDILCIL